jgi:hypothetical protein
MASLQSNPLFYQIAVTNADESQITGITVGNITATANLTSSGNTTLTGNLNASNISATKLTLAGTSNLSIGGGVSGQVLSTDGAGGLSWVSAASGTGTVTSVATATNNGGVAGFTLTGGPITGSGTITLNTPSVATLRSGLNIGNVANMSFGTDTQTFLRNDGTWATAGTVSGGGGSVTSVSGTGSGLGFSLGGTVTSTGSLSLTVPDALTLRNQIGLGNVSLQNFNGSSSQFLRGDGTWAATGSGGSSGGTVTSVGTAGGGGLGFNIATTSGSPITGSGTLTLVTPTSGQLRGTLGMGNVANANFTGSSTQFLRGDGTWAVVPTSVGTVAALNLNSDTSQFLRGDGTWATVPTNAGTVTSVSGSGSTLGFSLSGTVTSSGSIVLSGPTAQQLRGTLSIGTVANLNINGNTAQFLNGSGAWANIAIPTVGTVGAMNFNGSSTDYLRGDGTWQTVAGGSLGTVTSVTGTGGGLGITLSGTVTGSGSLTLTVPPAASLRTSLGIGTLSTMSLSGNASQVLNGAGTWVPLSSAVAGSDTQVQFNDGSVSAGSSNFTFDKTKNNLSVPSISVGKLNNICFTSEIMDVRTSFTSVIPVYLAQSSVVMITDIATANSTIQLSATSTDNLTTILDINEVTTVTVITQNSGTKYAPTAVQIAGSSYPIMWSGGTSAYNIADTTGYLTTSITVFRTGSSSYIVFGSASINK